MDRNDTMQIIIVVVNVALRKESVDRNDIGITTIDCISSVALRKESVDRNNAQISKVKKGQGRSPQGERG